MVEAAKVADKDSLELTTVGAAFWLTWLVKDSV